MQDIKRIYLPQLNKEDVVSYFAKMRPTRLGGNLLSRVEIQNKTVINNYGHGGAGISLAPGSAIKAVALSQYNNQKEPSKIAIIGSGIIGLFTAIQVVKIYPKAKVVVYSQRIPTFGNKNNKDLITSEVAPGFWLAYHYGSNNPKLHEQLCTLSYDEYKVLSQQERYKSCVKQSGIYDITAEPFKYEYFNNLCKELRPSFRQFKVKINDKTQVEARYFLSFRINMPIILKTLIQDLKSKGVRFQQKKILEGDLKGLSEEVIFNCAGLGSRELVKDVKVKGVKGHLIQYKNPNPQKYNIIFKANIGNQVINVYMHDDRIILGLTRQQVQNDDIDPSKVRLIQESYQKILQALNLSAVKPKL